MSRILDWPWAPMLGLAALITGLVPEALAAPPPNDDFSGDVVIQALPFDGTVDAVDATAAPDDPFSTCGYYGVTLWYAFTPSRSLRLEATSSYVSSVHVYTGTRGALTQVTCGVRGPEPPAVARFDADAGQTYYIMVGVFTTPPVPAPVTVTLREAPSPPDNDDFDTARPIATLPFEDLVDTSSATAATDDPWCYGPGPTVWYSFTPEEDLRIELDTAGSSYTAAVSVYTGGRGNLFQITCNAFGAGSQARVRFDAAAGITYHVMVGAYFGGTGGQLSLHARLAPPPFSFGLALDPRGTVRPSTGEATIRGTVVCSEPAFVSVSGVLRQDRPGQSAIDGFFGTFLECDGPTIWSATPSYSPRLFHGRSTLLYVGGHAEVSASADAFAAGSGENRQAFATAGVLLTGAH